MHDTQENVKQPGTSSVDPAANCSALRLRRWVQSAPWWARPLIGLSLIPLAMLTAPIIATLWIGQMCWDWSFGLDADSQNV